MDITYRKGYFCFGLCFVVVGLFLLTLLFLVPREKEEIRLVLDLNFLKMEFVSNVDLKIPENDFEIKTSLPPLYRKPIDIKIPKEEASILMLGCLLVFCGLLAGVLLSQNILAGRAIGAQRIQGGTGKIRIAKPVYYAKEDRYFFWLIDRKKAIMADKKHVDLYLVSSIDGKSIDENDFFIEFHQDGSGQTRCLLYQKK